MCKCPGREGKVCNCSGNCSKKKEEKKEAVPKEPLDKSAKICSKCKEKKATLKYREDLCCTECYIEFMEHRFKATIRSVMRVWKEDTLLTCFSGGPSSGALVKMLDEALHNATGRKMFFKVHLLHIDESVLYNEDPAKSIELVKHYAAVTQFPLDILRLEDIFDAKYHSQMKELGTLGTDTTNKRERLMKLLESMSPIASCREDLVESFKTAMMLQFAEEHGFTKVVLGTNGQRVAGKLFSQIAKGRGISLTPEGEQIDARYYGGKITLNKPLREFLEKEILTYCKFRGVEPFIIKRLSLAEITKVSKQLPNNGSIDHLIEDYITKLQADFPATVHTVLHTAGKVKQKFHAEPEFKSCPLCKGERDQMASILEIGQLLKKTDKEPKSISEHLQEQLLGKQHDYFATLCFGCRRMVENCWNQEAFFALMPEYAKEACEDTVQKKQYRKLNPEDVIKEFLIHDSDGEHEPTDGKA